MNAPRPLLSPRYFGRSWTLRNDSSRPDSEVECLLGFALAQTRGLDAKGTVFVKDPRPDGHGAGSGEAGDRNLHHRIPKWVDRRSRFYMRLTVPGDDWDWYGQPVVCWHSVEAKRLYGGMGRLAYRDHLARLYATGQKKLGRWPIFVVNNWREAFVHLAAHEAAHLLQYDRERGAGGSEIFCETFALEALNEYRAARPCGDEHSPPLGLVAGLAATAGPNPTHRKEPTVATNDTTTTADPKAAMTGLFETLLAEAKKVAPKKTATVEKAAYVRVDVLVADGAKHKTLAYINNPTTKSVRVEIPKKGGGGYDVIKVASEKDVPKAVKAIQANHDRIVASLAAA